MSVTDPAIAEAEEFERRAREADTERDAARWSRLAGFSRERVTGLTTAEALVSTWDRVPVEAPLGCVAEWVERIANTGMTRMTGQDEKLRRHHALHLSDPPLTQRQEVSADVLEALCTRADYAPNLHNSKAVGMDGRTAREVYVEVFGAVDLGKRSPKTVAASLPSYVEERRETWEYALAHRLTAEVWDKVVEERAEAHTLLAEARHTAQLTDRRKDELERTMYPHHSPRGRVKESLRELLIRRVPSEWDAALRHGVQCLVDRTITLSDDEYDYTEQALTYHLTTLRDAASWGDSDDAVDELIDHWLTSSSWKTGSLELHLDSNDPLRERW
ncbi:hypothetical protein [Mycolicibacterium porcinum]|uniref:DUF222 domain-containing protein n=1 Tax=Mycolicibacterium porcinum TaxID=39693 RepID=A0ABV3V6T6_9MYCO